MSIFENTLCHTCNFIQDQPYTAYNHAVLQKADGEEPKASTVVLGNRGSAFPQ